MDCPLSTDAGDEDYGDKPIIWRDASGWIILYVSVQSLWLAYYSQWVFFITPYIVAIKVLNIFTWNDYKAINIHIKQLSEGSSRQLHILKPYIQCIFMYLWKLILNWGTSRLCSFCKWILKRSKTRLLQSSCKHATPTVRTFHAGF